MKLSPYYHSKKNNEGIITSIETDDFDNEEYVICGGVKFNNDSHVGKLAKSCCRNFVPKIGDEVVLAIDGDGEISGWILLLADSEEAKNLNYIPEIKYGNRNGQYFTQWRFDLLVELLEMVQAGPGAYAEKLTVISPEIWYDTKQDYHRLRFVCNDRTIDVKLYKVFSCEIDGKDGWIGCPQRYIYEFAGFIRKELGIKLST